ncbi:MAG: ABC transporter substrate-binding protein/permease [Lactobacillales bacterium]|nr:ABC transporter substrate-binding protein/permease [Lactobacillales bacterium]
MALMPTSARAVIQGDSNEFRVGMECGYPPFNWTQTEKTKTSVKIDGDANYADGYDVRVAQKIADKLGKKLVVVKTDWDGLLPALKSGKIDAIVAGMSSTSERRKEIDFTNPYYTSNLVMVVNAHSKYAKATSLKSFKGAKITGQLGTFHYDFAIDQIPDVKKEPAMDNFPAMRVALESNMIDGYVSEEPEGITAELKNKNFKMINFAPGKGFKVEADDISIGVGLRKDDPDEQEINDYLATFTTQDQTKLMTAAIKDQPQDENEKENAFVKIIKQNGMMFLRGAGVTLFIALTSTIIGTGIGLLIGVFKTRSKAKNALAGILAKALEIVINVYIEVFRGTPMIVQAAVIYYGTGLLFGVNLDKIVAALVIVSINTGAYMSEIVRGGIFAVDKGQFEAAHAIGMTHGQTMRKIVLPQVIRNILPATGNEFVINIKDTSVLSVISVSELFFAGKTAAGANFMYFQTFFIICAIYFVMTFAVTRILRFIEKKLDGNANYVPIQNQNQVLGGLVERD